LLNLVKLEIEMSTNEFDGRLLRHIRTYPFTFINARPNLKTEKLLKENVNNLFVS